jgi:hypothetical protein
MSDNRRFVSLAVVVLAAALAVGGCKKNPPPQTNSQQPAQSQPATTQAQADQAAPAAQPAPPAQSASQPAPAPASQPSAAPPAAAPAAEPAPESATAAAPAPPPPPAPPQPTVVILPAGTQIRVRLDQDLGSKISQTGQTFRATVARAVVVDGQTLIPLRARAEGVVTDAEPLGKIKGEARLAITLQRVHTPWGSYPVATSSISHVEQGKGKRTAIMGGGGAGLGAILGGIAGGGKGALIGGLVGGGAGTAGSAFTGNKQIVLPTETLLTFRLQRSVHITTQP